MPLFKNKVLGAAQFTGLTPNDGLFLPKPGAGSIQVRINSLTYHTTVSSDFSIYQQDPSDSSNRTLILTEAGTQNIYLTNLVLPTENNYSWALSIVTTSKTVDGWLTIDYDFQVTEGA